MDLINQVADNIFQVQIPVPFPLKVVNCYMVREKGAWTMIDTGLQDERARAAWADAFRALQIEPRAIRQIVLTHAHPDHYGLAGYFQEMTGAPVLLLDKEMEIVPFEWKADGEHMRIVARYFKLHGMPADIGAGIHERQMQVLAMLQPQPVMSPLREGETIEIGGETYRIVWTPGHADGHMILHRADGLAFTGDHVLMKITPNIARWPGLDPNPLAHYLDSLDKVERLNLARALPGHRAVIYDLPKRLAELRAHHAARLRDCLAAARNCTAYEVCLEIFPRLKSADDVRMALVETLSHLEYLTVKGQLTQRTQRDAQGQELIFYARNA